MKDFRGPSTRASALAQDDSLNTVSRVYFWQWREEFPEAALESSSLATLGISPAGSDARHTAQLRLGHPPSLRMTGLITQQLPRYARDFACGLRRPQHGSTSARASALAQDDSLNY